VALFPETLDGPYNGSKAYLINLTQTLAHQLGPKGLRIQVVLPGITRTEIWELSGKDIGAIPADMVMETGTLVDAALAGFDLGEIVTIPTLEDLTDWNAMEAARLAMRPFLSRRDSASRYSLDPVS
jgi:short-subunit dehydrogenase